MRKRTLAVLVLSFTGAACAAAPTGTSESVKATAVEPVERGAESRPVARTAASDRRFYYTGSGHLSLQQAHGKGSIDVQYRRPDGSYDSQGLKRIRHFFRSRTDNREGEISLRLVELLGYIQEQFHPRTMALMSGYRSPQHNDAIRRGGAQAAKASLHTEGLAADVQLTGVDLRELWLQLRELETGGVGYYRSDSFLHIDTGKPRFWEETTSRVSEDLSAGNARVFARTEFDRYANVQGARLRVHGVTTFPLRVSRRAHLVDGNATHEILLSPGTGTRVDRDCIELPKFSPAYEMILASGPTKGQGRLILDTCAPRLEATPEQIESNRIDVGG